MKNISAIIGNFCAGGLFTFGLGDLGAFPSDGYHNIPLGIAEIAVGLLSFIFSLVFSREGKE